MNTQRCGVRTAHGTLCRRKGKGNPFRCHAHRTHADNAEAATHQDTGAGCAPHSELGDEVALDACPICLEDVYAASDAQLTCKHPIHLECAALMWRSACPICCRAITAPEGRLTQAHLDVIISKSSEGNIDEMRSVLSEYLPDNDFRERFREEMVRMSAIVPPGRREAFMHLVAAIDRYELRRNQRIND